MTTAAPSNEHSHDGRNTYTTPAPVPATSTGKANSPHPTATGRKRNPMTNANNEGLLRGDCLALLPTLPDASVHSIVTDPPYELGFMGKSWDSTGIAYNVQLWRECLRVLKPGGHLLAFGGSRTYHRLACAIEDAGFEIRDQIMWLYGSGFPKSLNVGKQEGCEAWEGWGTALKPAHEPIVVARKPLDGTVANNVLTHGVGALNIDASRIGTGTGKTREVEYPDIRGNNYNNAQGTVKYSVTDQGRWPANVIHDGSNEVLELFPETAAGARPAKANKPTGEHYEGGWGPISDGERVTFSGGSAARFFYCAKASRSERNQGLDEFEQRQTTGGGGLTAEVREDGSLETASAGGKYGSIKAKQQNHHPTVKPLALIRYLITLVTPPGGTVLDPFLGSGTTAVAATQLGHPWIGCEVTPDYWHIIQARINHAERTQ